MATIRTRIRQDELMKMVLDGGEIRYQQADGEDDVDEVVIEVEEVEGLFKDKEILQRIKRIANTQTVEQ